MTMTMMMMNLGERFGFASSPPSSPKDLAIPLKCLEFVTRGGRVCVVDFDTEKTSLASSPAGIQGTAKSPTASSILSRLGAS